MVQNFLTRVRARPLLFGGLLAFWLLLRGCDGIAIPAAASSISTPQTIRTVVTVPSAAILNLFTSPFTVVAAPGAGKVIAIRTLYARLNYGTATYAPGFGSTLMFYGATSQAATSGAFDTLIGSASTVVLGPNVGTGAGGVLANVINAPVVLRKATQDFTTGDGTLTLWVTYDVIDLN